MSKINHLFVIFFFYFNSMTGVNVCCYCWISILFLVIFVGYKHMLLWLIGGISPRTTVPPFPLAVESQRCLELPQSRSQFICCCSSSCPCCCWFLIILVKLQKFVLNYSLSQHWSLVVQALLWSTLFFSFFQFGKVFASGTSAGEPATKWSVLRVLDNNKKVTLVIVANIQNQLISCFLDALPEKYSSIHWTNQ